MKRKILKIIILSMLSLLLFACDQTPKDPIDDDDDPIEPIGWDGEQITYAPEDIALMDASIPQGYALINPNDQNSAIIKSLSPELDNFGGISTGILTLDFNYAVYFQMDIVSVYNEYIVKLFIEGERDAFYVLSDEGKTGFISVNVVNSMLSEKYRERDTQPDPGYESGFKYDKQIKNAFFYIMPKGPDGELRTAEMILKSIRITNFKTPSIVDLFIESDQISNGNLEKLKGSNPVKLHVETLPIDIEDNEVVWSSENPNIATVSSDGTVSFVGVGKTNIIATSVIDQSKSKRVPVNVLSGFEQKESLNQALQNMNLTTPKSTETTHFDDLFNTSWDLEDQMYQKIQINNQPIATDIHLQTANILVENYFDKDNAAHVAEVNQFALGNHAAVDFRLFANNQNIDTLGSATIYRDINGILTKETRANSSEHILRFNYASLSDNWQKNSSYTERGIIVWSSGVISKYTITNKAVTLVKSYHYLDFLNTEFWQDGDSLLLSPASVRDNGNQTITIREEATSTYNSQFPFGGLISERFDLDPNLQYEFVLHITETNPSRVLWNIRMVYFAGNQRLGNPLNIIASNRLGRQTVPFNLIETETSLSSFRIYLVANGSDISIVAPGAEIKLSSLKIHTVDQ
jgi:hypothetical protein